MVPFIPDPAWFVHTYRRVPTAVRTTLPPPNGTENPPPRGVVPLTSHVAWLTSTALWLNEIVKTTVSPEVIVIDEGENVNPEDRISWTAARAGSVQQKKRAKKNERVRMTERL